MGVQASVEGQRIFMRVWHQHQKVTWGVVLILLAIIPVFAQLPTGTILGVVKDASGAVVPAATVTIRNADTDQTRTVTTGDDGAFRVPALGVGNYSVRIEKEGFKSVTQQGLVLNVDQELVVNVSLELGTSTQEVTVTGEAPLVNTTSSATGGLVNEEQMANLPLNGRNYVDLALLQPGVQQQIMPASGGAGGSGVYFSSNGAGIRSNYFTIDGAEMMNSYGGGTSSEAGTTLGVDGIKEYKVVTHSFSAEYGPVVGSSVQIVSKGGTNQWSGGAFEYLRNSAMDARNFFDTGYLRPGAPRLPEFQRNNFGASFGGPIQKDKTFFFAVYEGLREVLGVTNTETTFPSACQNIVQHGANYAFQTTAIATSCASGLTGLDSPTPTVIPAVIVPWLRQFPIANLANNQYTYPASAHVQVNYGQIRVDHTFSASDSMFSRYTIDKSYLVNPSGLTVLTDTLSEWPQFSTSGASLNQYLTLAENHIFSPNLLNTARVSWSRTNLDVGLVYNDVPLNPAGQAGLTTPQFSFIPGQTMGTLSIGGISGFGPNSGIPAYHIFAVGSLSDDLYYTRGKHAFKFGTLLNRDNDPNWQQFTTTGAISFGSVSTFMTGQPSQYSAQTAYTSPTGPGCAAPCGVTYPFVTHHDYIWNTLGFYAQDDWRAKPNLTLNLGMRYEIMTSLHELNGTESCIPDILTSDTFQVGCLVRNYTLGNWSPRVGFAWDIKGDGKMAIRGGSGIYYDVGNIPASIHFSNANGMPPYVGRSLVQTSAPIPIIQIPLVFPASSESTQLRVTDYNMKSPTSIQYDLTFERQLPFNMVLSAGYVGTRAYHQWANTEGDPCTPTGTTSGVASWINAGNISCPLGRVNPYWGGGVVLIASAAESWYNALQTTLTKRVSHGLELQATYSWSHALDTSTGEQPGLDCGSDLAVADNPMAQNLNKQPACFDLRNVLHATVLYHAPNVKSDRAFAKAINGWWFSTIVSVDSGYPFSPALSNNRSLDAYQGGNADNPSEVTTAATVPLAVTGGTYSYNFVPFNANTVILGSPNNWFNPLMFELQPTGTLGNVPRGILRGPDLRDMDFAVNKDTALPFLGEKGVLQFRAEIFNILNRANFGLPNATTFAGAATTAVAGGFQAPTGASTTNPLGTAGQITTTIGTSRQIQLALKVVF